MYEPDLLPHSFPVYWEAHQHREQLLEAVVEEEGRRSPAWGEVVEGAAEAWCVPSSKCEFE